MLTSSHALFLYSFMFVVLCFVYNRLGTEARLRDAVRPAWFHPGGATETVHDVSALHRRLLAAAASTPAVAAIVGTVPRSVSPPLPVPARTTRLPSVTQARSIAASPQLQPQQGSTATKARTQPHPRRASTSMARLGGRKSPQSFQRLSPLMLPLTPPLGLALKPEPLSLDESSGAPIPADQKRASQLSVNSSASLIANRGPEPHSGRAKGTL